MAVVHVLCVEQLLSSHPVNLIDLSPKNIRMKYSWC